jgi:hypothetical protein
MRRIALVCAVLCLCTTAAVAWGHEVASHPAPGHGSRSHHAKPRTHKRGSRHGATKKSTKKPTRSTFSRKTSSHAASATTDPALFGDQTVESTADNNKSGLAEAFPFAGHINGTARSINVYLDSHSTATSLLAAIYADNNGQPGSLLAGGKLSSPKAGAWNALPISATSVSASKSYWLAVLGKGGMLYFRDRPSGPCQSLNSRQTSLAAMPSAWVSGSQWTTCPVSAFVAGTAKPVTTSANPPSVPPTTTTTTTTSGGTTTTPSPLPPLPVPPLDLLAPQISGTTMQGQTLTTDNGTWLDGPTSYSYHWQDCDTSGNNCSSISGATSSSYTLARGDVGDTIRVVVTAINAAGPTPATSSQTGAVQALPAPSNTTLPSISGTAQQGQALSTSKGTWTGSPTSYAYQWQDCDSSGASCAAISGATSSSHTLTANDTSHTVRVVVTATNSAGSATATSTPTQAVTAPSATQNCAGTPGSQTVNQSSLDACGFPSMNTTGPPAGTSMTSSGGFTASTAGKVYDGLNVNGSISITASNVTIQNSNITDVDKDNAAIQIASGVTGTVIKYDSIHGTNTGQSGSLAFAVSYFGNTINGVTIDHVNFYNGDRILAGYGTVTNSYCLGGANFNNSGGLEHDECIYTDGGSPGIRAIHDTLLVDNAQTAAIFVDNPDFGGGGTNGTLDVENSILAGGGYCIYAGAGRSTPHTGPVTITNNRFTRIYFSDCGQFGPDAYVSNGATWTSNVWDDTNQDVGS